MPSKLFDMVKKNKHKKEKGAITALSITVICFSSFTFIAGIIGLIYIAIAFGQAQMGETANQVAQNAQLSLNTSISEDFLVIGNTSFGITDLINQGLWLIFSFTLFTILSSIFSFVIAVINLLKVEKKDFPESLFLLNFFSSIFSLLSISIVRCTLTAITSFFAYRIRK